MRILFIAVLVITGMSAYAQEQRSGAIKTRDGFLIYFNYPENAFTLNVEGDADISKFPFIKTKGNYIQFQHAAKSEFGTTTPEVLTKYRKWEADYLKEMFGGKDIDIKNETIDRNGVTYSFWSHRTPLPEDALAPDVTPVKEHISSTSYTTALFSGSAMHRSREIKKRHSPYFLTLPAN